jgi:ABC-type transport system substrate-binding protein
MASAVVVTTVLAAALLAPSALAATAPTRADVQRACSVPASPGGPDPCNPPPEERSRAWAPQELIDIGVSAPRTFAPGQGWAYTNTGYQLLSG